VVDTCFYGVVYTTRAPSQWMRKQKTVTSFRCLRPWPPRVPAIRRITRPVGRGRFSDSLAMEVAPFESRSDTGAGRYRRPTGRGAPAECAETATDYKASVGSFLKILEDLKGFGRRSVQRSPT